MPRKNEITNPGQGQTRREFIKDAALGGSALLLLGNLGVLRVVESHAGPEPAYSMIVVDYDTCTGCRTCEVVCSSFNHRQEVDGKTLLGLGNPKLSNIQVHSFNPDVDVPAVCAMCPDNPCVAACPVEPDPKTGRKALYRDPSTFAVTCDQVRCIGCGECAQACRVGVIESNPETNHPERMCTLCGGDPQCVKHCPYGSLSHVKVDVGREFYGLRPEKIAENLTARWYQG